MKPLPCVMRNNNHTSARYATSRRLRSAVSCIALGRRTSWQACFSFYQNQHVGRMSASSSHTICDHGSTERLESHRMIAVISPSGRRGRAPTRRQLRFAALGEEGETEALIEAVTELKMHAARGWCHTRSTLTLPHRMGSEEHVHTDVLIALLFWLESVACKRSCKVQNHPCLLLPYKTYEHQ